ncbi:pleiotropic drug resistance protein 1-like [Quercus suber]|uniref:pleiotropic drug resistance protein 1-like n=1 Tax=Quercus suber TaxID=58331 RepID=UPI0032DE73DD
MESADKYKVGSTVQLSSSSICRDISSEFFMKSSREDDDDEVLKWAALQKLHTTVTSYKDQEQYWAQKDKPYNFVTVKEFAEAFQSSHVGWKLRDELAARFDKAKSHPASLTTKKYGVKKEELLKACLSREFLLMKRNSFVYIFKFIQLTVLAMIAMTTFLRIKMHRNSVEDGGIYTGALFYGLVVILFNGIAEMPMTVAKLPVFYKQKKLLFYPPWVYSLPPWIVKIPITFVEVAAWVFITYYVIGFDPSPVRFFRQFLLLILLNQMASSLFRFIATTGRGSLILATTFGSFALVILFALGGFVLARENIKKWWIWGYWMSPMMYAQNAIVVNEFLGKSWRHVLPNSTEPLGIEVLKSRGFFPHAYWYWIGVGALIGFVLLFNAAFTLALTYLNPLGKPQSVISAEPQSNGSIDASVEVNQSRKTGMILPFDPHTITFDEVKYSVDMPQEMKNQGVIEDKLVLLNGESAAFRPGVLTALMGVTGAGKTTLMDVLAGRKTGGYIEGKITISGYPKKQETFARISGYCEQNDIHSPNVTVYESLLYSAWLRLSPDVDSQKRKVGIQIMKVFV